MTRQDNPATPQTPYAERRYRSPAGLAGGVLLLLLVAWLGADVLVRGDGRARLLSISWLVFVVPLVLAFTLRPQVRAGEDRLVVRNPFRTITIPWASVEDLRASLSSEVLAGGAKYQLWAIPVSLRQRKRANRQAARATSRPERGRFGTHPNPHATAHSNADVGPPPRAIADRSLDELRELKERNAGREGAQGAPTVRWAYEIIAPSVVGLVVLVVLYAL